MHKHRRMIDWYRDDIANARDLSGSEKGVANALMRAMDFDTLKTTPISNETLVLWSGFSPRTVERAVASLVLKLYLDNWRTSKRLRRGFRVADKSASSTYRGIGRKERKRRRERDASR